jgi:hypothetical protein
MVETEIKLRGHGGPDGARALLEQHDFRATGPRQLETVQAFDLPTGEATSWNSKGQGPGSIKPPSGWGSDLPITLHHLMQRFTRNIAEHTPQYRAI